MIFLFPLLIILLVVFLFEVNSFWKIIGVLVSLFYFGVSQFIIYTSMDVADGILALPNYINLNVLLVLISVLFIAYFVIRAVLVKKLSSKK